MYLQGYLRERSRFNVSFYVDFRACLLSCSNICCVCLCRVESYIALEQLDCTNSNPSVRRQVTDDHVKCSQRCNQNPWIPLKLKSGTVIREQNLVCKTRPRSRGGRFECLDDHAISQLYSVYDIEATYCQFTMLPAYSHSTSYTANLQSTSV